MLQIVNYAGLLVTGVWKYCVCNWRHSTSSNVPRKSFRVYL